MCSNFTFSCAAAAIFVNRALCYKKIRDMAAVERDAACALELDKDNLKVWIIFFPSLQLIEDLGFL